jgi:hypothetical protein
METLIKEVDSHIASTFTLSMSRDPINPASKPQTAEDFEDCKWVKIGTQVGFNPRRIGSLWHSLSNLALHTQLPKAKNDHFSLYGNQDKVADKVNETLIELKRIANGTLLSSGFGPEVSFKCECGRANRRRTELLGDGQIVRCIGFDCNESYTVSIDGENIDFIRRMLVFDCDCGNMIGVQARLIEEMRDQLLTIECKCGKITSFAWRLMRTQPSAPASARET